jgi:uncharacterized protein YdeI (YjbR/CyaY-like superfamily)
MRITNSFTPTDQADWRAWLEKNHQSEKEIWLVYFKPASGRTNIDYDASVEEALCFGWIDSVIQKIDEEKYARKFNPRRLDSKWSESNRRRVEKLINEGRMTEAGLAKVTFDIIEVDDDLPKPKRSPVVMPGKIAKALKSRPGVWQAFQKISPSHRRNYILWLSDAKKPETFERRLKIAAEVMLAGKPTSMH